MACCSQLKSCNVHVYERSTQGFKRISAFDHADNPQSKPVVRVLYCGGIHYGKILSLLIFILLTFANCYVPFFHFSDALVLI